MFRIGEEVVCVDAKGFESELTEGQHYVIRWQGMYPVSTYVNTEPLLCVRVEGVVRDHPLIRPLKELISIGIKHGDIDDSNDPSHLLDDVPFRATRFAPIKKTDISVLESLLVPTTPVKVLEEV